MLVRESAPKNDWDVFFRSTDRSGALSFRELHAAGLGLVLQADLVCRVDLPAGVQQSFDLGFHLGHASGDGFLVAVLVERVGQLETQPAQAQEQLVRGVRLVLDIEHDLHDVTYRWDVPELGVGARPGGRPGQDGLEFLFLVAGEFRRVLVPRMAGQDRAHPGGPPVSQPFLHGPLRPLATISAMMPTSTPREAYRIASVFIRTST